MSHKNFIPIIISLLAIYGANLRAEQLKVTEHAIRQCESNLHKAHETRIWLSGARKPKKLSSSKTRELFANREYYLLAFDTAYKEFAEFSNYKNELRKEQNSNSLIDKINLFDNKCLLYANTLKSFANWSLGGKATVNETKIFKIWLNQAKCGKDDCP